MRPPRNVRDFEKKSLSQVEPSPTKVYLIFPSLIQFDIVRFYVFNASVSHVPQQGLFKRPGLRPLCTLDLQPSSCPTCRLGDRRKKSLRHRRGDVTRPYRRHRLRDGGLQAQGLDTGVHQPQHKLDLQILQVLQVQKSSLILQVLEGSSRTVSTSCRGTPTWRTEQWGDQQQEPSQLKSTTSSGSTVLRSKRGRTRKRFVILQFTPQVTEARSGRAKRQRSLTDAEILQVRCRKDVTAIRPRPTGRCRPRSSCLLDNSNDRHSDLPARGQGLIATGPRSPLTAEQDRSARTLLYSRFLQRSTSRRRLITDMIRRGRGRPPTGSKITSESSRSFRKSSGSQVPVQIPKVRFPST